MSVCQVEDIVSLFPAYLPPLSASVYVHHIHTNEGGHS